MNNYTVYQGGEGYLKPENSRGFYRIKNWKIMVARRRNAINLSDEVRLKFDKEIRSEKWIPDTVEKATVRGQDQHAQYLEFDVVQIEMGVWELVKGTLKITGRELNG